MAPHGWPCASYPYFPLKTVPLFPCNFFSISPSVFFTMKFGGAWQARPSEEESLLKNLKDGFFFKVCSQRPCLKHFQICYSCLLYQLTQGKNLKIQTYLFYVIVSVAEFSHIPMSSTGLDKDLNPWKKMQVKTQRHIPKGARVVALLSIHLVP